MLLYHQFNTSINDVLVGDFNEFDHTKQYVAPKSVDFLYSIFDHKFLDKLQEFSPIANAMLFGKPPMTGEPQIHVDITEMMALNFILTKGSPGTMQWFVPKVDNKKNIEYSVASTPLSTFKIDEVNYAGEFNLTDKLTLTRVDLPHRIIVGDSYRTCFSLRFKDTSLTVENSLERLLKLGL